MVLVFLLAFVTFFIKIYIHTNVLGSYLPKFCCSKIVFTYLRALYRDTFYCHTVCLLS